MKIARANEKDLDAAMAIVGILDDIADDRRPRRFTQQLEVVDDGEDDEAAFNPDTFRDLRELYDRLLFVIQEARPGALSRVVFNMHTVLQPENGVVDLESTSLELHPRIVAALAAVAGSQPRQAEEPATATATVADDDVHKERTFKFWFPEEGQTESDADGTVSGKIDARRAAEVFVELGENYLSDGDSVIVEGVDVESGERGMFVVEVEEETTYTAWPCDSEGERLVEDGA